MAYPYATLPTNRQNDTSTGDPSQPTAEGFHAKSENDFARALNDLLVMLGADPAGEWANLEDRLDAEILFLRAIRSVGLIPHGATANTARPTTHFAYIWRGSVVPTNLLAGRDVYMPTTSDTVGSGGGGGPAGQEVVAIGNVSGSVALNMSGRVNTLFTATPTGTTTFSIPNFIVPGQWCELRITQPSTPQSVTLPGGQPLVGPMTVPATAGAILRFGWQYIGGLNIDCWNLGNTAAP